MVVAGSVWLSVVLYGRILFQTDLGFVYVRYSHGFGDGQWTCLYVGVWLSLVVESTLIVLYVYLLCRFYSGVGALDGCVLRKWCGGFCAACRMWHCEI